MDGSDESDKGRKGEGYRRAGLRQARILRGSAIEALEFARRACEYLRPKGVESVEAWSLEISDHKFHISEEEPEIPGLARFV